KKLKEDQRLVVVIDGRENTTKTCRQTILRKLINFFTAQTTQAPLDVHYPTGQAAFAKIQFIIAGCLAPVDLRLENGFSFTEYSTKTFLEDFNFENVDKMIQNVCGSHAIRLDEGFTRLLYEWTGGTGYLIQKICYKILETAFLSKSEPAFSTMNGDEAISSIIREGETNVELIMQGIERDNNLVEALIRIMRNGAMQSYKFDPDLHTLVSLGALSLRNGRFRVRNPMFEKIFQDYFTSERLANLFYTRKRYFRAKELFFNAVTQEIDAKNALDNLLTAIKSIQESANHVDFMNNALQVLMHTVEGVRTSSFFLVDAAHKKLRITDSIGMSTEDLSRVNLQIGEGVAGSVAQTGRIRVIRDVTDEVECPDFVYRDLAEKLDIGAMISLPVFVAGEVIGVINLCLGKPNEFTYSETKMLEILATQISSALQQQPLFNSISHHEAMLEVLEDAILTIDSHIDAEIIFGKILESAYSITGCKKNYAIWKDNVTNSWKFKFPNWTVKQEPNGQTSRIISKNRKSGAMFGQGKIYMTPDLENDDRYLNIWKSLHTNHAFRITVDGETMGCL
ncbi:MAG: GAF domain-containing protein, partial [bacterium]